MTQIPAEPPSHVQPQSHVQSQPLGYGETPTGGLPTGYATPAPMRDSGQSSSQNILGILALIAPFVGLAPAGIVLGHMGLSAVKNGRANNGGIAIAGTVLSWIATAIAVAIIISLVSDRKAAVNEAALKTDIMTVEIEAYNYVAATGQDPSFAFSDGNYIVGGTLIPASPEVTGARLLNEGNGFFCFEVNYGEGLVMSRGGEGRFSDGC